MAKPSKTNLLDDLRRYLGTFEEEHRIAGRSISLSGSITDFQAREDGQFACALMEEFETTLEYLPSERIWFGDCACIPIDMEEDDCPHIFALGTLLMSEFSQASVREISSGKAVRQPTQKPPPRGGFEESVRNILNRPLNSNESHFCKLVSRLYERSKSSQRVSLWDLHDLGLPVRGVGWEALKPWVAYPENEWEFWLHIAQAILDRKGSIPSFLDPITNLQSIREIRARAERELVITRWQNTFFHVPEPSRAVPLGTGHELRIAAEFDGLKLEIKSPGGSEFQKITPTKFRDLLQLHTVSQLWNSPESELICDFFANANYNSAATTIPYNSPGSQTTLNRLLRARHLESYFVNVNRVPLERPTAPLKWRLTPPESVDGDYRLRLVMSDGSSAPGIMKSVAGIPYLYLTQEGIYTGPLAPDGFDLDESIVIPAPAIERTEGIRFLMKLGLEIPESLQNQVEIVPYKIKIECALKPDRSKTKTERCYVSVQARNRLGEVLSFNDSTWFIIKEAKPAGGDSKKIVINEREWLVRTPALLAPLQLKPSDYPIRDPHCKVTRAFPDLFSNWVKGLPPEVELVLDSELESLANPEVSGTVRLDVQEAQIDWFDLKIVLQMDDTTLTPEEVNLLLKARGGLVRLPGRGWRKLVYNLTPEDDQRLAGLGLSPHEFSDEPQRLHALQLADEGARKFLPAEQVEQVSRRASEIRTSVAPPLPTEIKATLRPYQLEGFHFLAYLSTNNFGGILADDMGLGKTLQTLAWFIWLRAEALKKAPDKPPAPSLVVCPKSVMDNWRAEPTRFAPDLRVRTWSATELPKFKEEAHASDLNVINYSQLRTLETDLLDMTWLAVVLDEGQYIKNPNSQTAQIARTVKAGHRLILTGTPIENRLLDLWSLMSFAMPGVLGTRASFLRIYDGKTDPLARRRLAARVRPFLLRRTKSQVAKDLPDRIEEDIFCEMEGEQKTLYRAELKHAQQMLLRVQTQKQLAKQTFHFLTSMLRLRQICCDPRLVNPSVVGQSAKLEALIGQVEPLMEEGHKVLIFSQFVELLQLLKPELERKEWPIYYLAGETENRGALVEQFQAHEGGAVFLISLKAGGFGLNLTSASYVVLFDPWWNPAVENQAIDRTHRIGQTRKVIAYRLLIKGSIEEKIRALQKQKSALVQDVLGEEKFAQGLTLNDLQFLFSD